MGKDLTLLASCSSISFLYLLNLLLLWLEIFSLLNSRSHFSILVLTHFLLKNCRLSHLQKNSLNGEKEKKKEKKVIDLPFEGLALTFGNKLIEEDQLRRRNTVVD